MELIMNTKNIVLSLTIAGIVTSSALMPMKAMKRTWDDNDPTMQDHHLSKKTKTSDVVTMSDFFESLPNEMNDHIGQFLVPAHLDLTNPAHIKIIRTIVRYKNINRYFHHTIVPLCLRHIREITLSNAIITNQQKFNRFLAFLSQLINLNSISLSGTNITDQQLSALLDVVNRNKIKQLKLSYCHNLHKPTLNNLPALTKLDLSFCCNLQNPTINNLPALTTLYLFGTNITDTLLSNILDHGNFKNSLAELNLSVCRNLHNTTLNNLPALISLNLSFCCNLQNPTINNLPALISLDLSSCFHLKNPVLNNLPALTKLDLSVCFHLQNPIFNNLPALTKLYLFLCPNLALVTLSTTMQHLHLEQQHPLIHFNYVNNQ